MIARRSRAKHLDALQAVSPMMKLWLLRMLIPLGGQRRMMRGDCIRVDALTEIFRLDEGYDGDPDDLDDRKVAAKLRKLYREMEAAGVEPDRASYLAGNMERLSELVGLTDTDRRILEFVVMLKTEQVMDDTSDLLGQLSTTRVFHVLSVILDISESEIREALSLRGVLTQSGLVTLARNGSATLGHKLDLLSDAFADHIQSSETDPVHLLRDTVTPASPAHLALADYAHIDSWLRILGPYLGHAVAAGRRGVNVFVYGPPGTGKSELARTLAKELGCELFEIASEDEDGDPVDGEQRLRAFRAAQSFLAQRHALVVFDEVEDVFNGIDDPWGRKSAAQARKAWINRMLESNRVPALWLSNSVHCLDDAFIRRFDMVIELPVPPKKQRIKIIRKASGGLLDDAAIGRFAESDALSPAVVTRSASVVLSIRDSLDPAHAVAAMEQLVNSTLQAQSHRPIATHGHGPLPQSYDPAFVCADSDLGAIAAGLMKSRAGRLCLYGPPGTGKTAFGHWLAQQLGVPLIVKRASDLLSKWLGDNEKNLAEAFRRAEEDGAVLLIDEVDSFLQDRRHASRSWEVTGVNEMLTQMEAFEGIFIASTNLIDGLDQAALRRFDLKVKFGYLQPAQAWQLLCRQADVLEFTAPPQELKFRLTRLTTLAPGDFAAVARRHRFHPLGSAVDFVRALEEECALKEDRHQAIGFV